MANEIPEVLTIAGSDSDGSAGMEADLHSFFMRGAYGTVVLTTAVAGNSYGIHDSVTLPLEFIDHQFDALADDLHIRAAKTGMLANAAMINTVVKNLKKYDFGPLVLDPVIVTIHGALLLEQDAFETLKSDLIPLATLITPNFYEAEHLTNLTLDSDDQIEAAAEILQQMGAKNVMIKGDHTGENRTEVRDFVRLESGKTFWLSDAYHKTDRVNGTGDTLSAVITAEIGKGNSIEDAIRIAKRFVNEAIANEIPVGHQFGPINHWANPIVTPQF
ncbi:bifunctional hydroxymethylpyrimidine kinase/phosphomethylpyrimidine kinase [Lacticaseibacillus brantae]|uniref:Hydroxymethylpyrimidine/phosphomethylpyrimidine kinase n=1 Tax=Lacticaseibacillus brantae DSM 23927 TaxID=1423727 RepID=A0A0R2AWX3_9LACO|nr:bifunctional hydroxymethylpyrimidine kinase/phosphomethylpyrimidine kinase [Lacticaseibacillus brantae]KRM71912.1 phosphomethylpyrimidine kinase [Lacticaseibacillus brantae DSM 23927]